MKTSFTIDQLIQAYDLTPHPEGGFFKESYRSTEAIHQTALPDRFAGARAFSTAIYYLLPQGAKSRLHRIASDEVWHFYLGGPLIVVELLRDGQIRNTVLGQNILQGERLQHVVHAGTWFGAYPDRRSDYSFVGCTVAPGFDFSDFEMGDRASLLKQYPQAHSTILALTDP